MAVEGLFRCGEQQAIVEPVRGRGTAEDSWRGSRSHPRRRGGLLFQERRAHVLESHRQR